MNVGIGVLILALLSAGLTLQLREPPAPGEAPTASRSAPAAPEPLELPAPEIPSIASLDDTVARPLFLPDRSPPPPEAEPEAPAAAPAPEAPPPNHRLSGVVIIRGEPLAILAGAASTPRLRVRVGDPVDGWTVDSIAADAVILANGERRHEIALRRFEAPPPPPKKTASKAPVQPAAAAPAVQPAPATRPGAAQAAAAQPAAQGRSKAKAPAQ